MKEHDEITGLFRNRLSGAEMTVRDGFWDELQGDLSAMDAVGATTAAATTAASVKTDGSSAQKQKGFALTPRLYRVAAAASVALVLGVASASFWFFSPKEEIQEAFTKVATMTPGGNIKGDVVQESFPSIYDANPTAKSPGHKLPGNPVSPVAVAANDDEDNESISVTVSITITQQTYNQHNGYGAYNNNYSNHNRNGYHNANNNTDSKSSNSSNAQSKSTESTLANADNLSKKHNWAFKAGLGTSLPKGDFGMPFTANFSAERRLSKSFSLEAGLQYNYLDGGNAIHTLAVPVKLNALLASNSKVDLYATVGGAAEKCIAGAEDNGFGAEPIQLSVAAGLGVRYKLNDRIALFAEPTVSHHFDTDSQTKSLRTERQTNFNLLCGVRMTY